MMDSLVKPFDQLPVIIVGAGLAGLACALTLQEQHIPCRVIEAGPAPGGRVRSDVVDGFVLDRGFQVLLTSYPQAKRFWDYDALNLGSFLSGASCYTGQSGGKRFITVADPLRHPELALTESLPDVLQQPVITPADLIRLLKLRHQATAPEDEGTLWQTVPETTSRDFLAQEGFSPQVRRLFLDPFYKGVFLDPGLTTSARKLVWTLRHFATGRAVLPAGGMGQLTWQLANRLRPGTLRLDTPVAAVRACDVTLATGEVLPARGVVLATDWQAAAQLLGNEVPLAATAGTTCLYYHFPAKPPGTLPQALYLNGCGTGRINNWCFPSEVAAGYAPEGRTLACITLVGTYDEPDESLFTSVLAELETLYGEPLAGWHPLALYRIPNALPAETTLYGSGTFIQRIERAAQEQGLILAGDYLGSGSIDGALSSGRRTADALSLAYGSGTMPV